MPLNTQEHTSKRYDAELETVRSRVLQMGGLVETQITAAIEALSTGNLQLAEQTIANDHRVNALEVQIDEDCAHIIARRQPAAQDLRMIVTIIKMITDLERIGDEAEKIARMAKRIHEEGGGPFAQRFPAIRHAAQIAVRMLRQALDAFARLDAGPCADVVKEDAAIDDEFRSVLRSLITYMMGDPRTISTALEIVWVAKAIERIGDHAKNLAEQVIYIVRGTDVRHSPPAEVDREVAKE